MADDQPQPGRLIVHMDKNIGQEAGRIVVEQKRNTDGTTYWKASTRITHIFGSPIEGGHLEGFGTTEQEARDRLEEEEKKFNDSLWDEF